MGARVDGAYMRFQPLLAIVVSVIAAGLVGVIAWVSISFRTFDVIEPGGTLTRCTPVVGINGAVDLVRIPGRNEIYLSTMDRRAGALRGGVLRFDVDNPLDNASWRDRTGGVPVKFSPLGIDYFERVVGQGQVLRRLFVVNGDKPQVLLFDIDANGDLALRETFTDPRLVNPYDVVATGPRSFYVTNHSPAPRGTWRAAMDFYFGLKTGSVLHFDGSSWTDLVTDLAHPQGLTLSADGEALFVAEMRAKRVRKFDRDPRTDSVTEAATTPLGFFPENLSVDEAGYLLVATILQPLNHDAYASGKRNDAPSQLLRVTPGGEIETVYRDSGNDLAAATQGVKLGDQILIGSLAAPHFLMCKDDK